MRVTQGRVRIVLDLRSLEDFSPSYSDQLCVVREVVVTEVRLSSPLDTTDRYA